MDQDQRCKIVALTAYETEKFKLKSLESGMDEFISKPVTKE